MSKNVFLYFDPEKRELSVQVGDGKVTETLIIDHFQKDTKGCFINVLQPLGQEKLIKKLVANMSLKEN